MWIKKTVVKSKEKNYTYIQLVQSKMINGKSRQIVIANLGRMDKLDIAAVEGLAKILSSKVGDTLPPAQINLLPVQHYGAHLLVQHLYGTYRLEQFLTELAHYKNLSLTVLPSAYAILLYYFLFDNPSVTFSSFIKKYYIPGAEGICNETLFSAFTLLEKPVFYCGEAIDSTSSDLPHMHYIISAHAENLKGVQQNAFCQISTDTKFSPISFQSSLEIENFPKPKTQDILIGESPQFLLASSGFDPNSSPFICRADTNHLPLLFNTPSKVISFFQSGGLFLEFGNIGYKIGRYENKMLLLIRPSGGEAPSLNNDYAEPRECIITNIDRDPQWILSAIAHLDLLQDCFYSVFLPKDLKFLYERITPKKLLFSVLTFLFIKILFRTTLSQTVTPLGLTAEEAICVCDDILTTQIFDGTSLRRFHSEISSEQNTIFLRLGMKRPPAISFRKSGKNSSE